jgi:hypothetical protein
MINALYPCVACGLRLITALLWLYRNEHPLVGPFCHDCLRQHYREAHDGAPIAWTN